MSDWIEMHALADGQLEGDAKARAEAAMASSPAMKAEYEAVLAVKNAVSKVDPATCVKTWEKCRARLDEFQKKEEVESFVGRYAWGLCSIIFVVMLAGALFNRMRPDQVRTGDVARVLSGFTSSMARGSANPGDEMANWIQSRDRNTLTVLQSQPAWVNGFPGTIYQLQDRSGPLVYVTVRGVERVEGVEPMLDDQTYSVSKINGTNCLTWQSGSQANLLIAERSYEDLAKTAETLRE